MLRPKTRPFALFLLAIFAAPLFAQQPDTDVLPGVSFEINGQVRFAIQNGAVERANIRLEGFGGNLLDQTLTDSRGRFRFTRLRRGQYIVTVKTPGYREEKQQVEVSQFLRRAQIFFELKPDNTERPVTRPSRANMVFDARVPMEAQNEFEKGSLAFKNGEEKQAITHLEKAISLYAEFTEAYLLLAEVQMKAERWDKADKALTRLLKIKPQSTDALIDLAEVYRRQKRYAEAEKTLKELLRLDEKSWHGHFTLGRVYWETDKFVEAGHQIGRTLELMPDLAEAHLLAGNIFMRVNLPANALIEYEEYLRLAPKGEFADQTKELVQKLKAALAKQKR